MLICKCLKINENKFILMYLDIKSQVPLRVLLKALVSECLQELFLCLNAFEKGRCLRKR